MSEQKNSSKQQKQKQLSKNNPRHTIPQFEVQVFNRDKYVEGKFFGGWISLPASYKKIKAFLKTRVGLTPLYEAYVIYGHSSAFRFAGCDDLFSLNLLAVMLERLSKTEKNLVAAYCNHNGIVGVLGVLNVCMQVDGISFVEFSSFVGSDVRGWCCREKNLGYAMVDVFQPDLKVALEQCKLGGGLSAYDYFDFEKYGRDISINEGYFATDEIFICYTTDIDPKRYTIQELKKTTTQPRLEKPK